MSGKEKLIERFKKLPKDFTFDEVERLLGYFGYEKCNKGKTSGSRVSFINPDNEAPIILHKPHPQKVLKSYAIKQLCEELKERKLIK